MKAVCALCPRHCNIPEGSSGFCRARVNRDGNVCLKNYGLLSSMALDPIGKKPLARFFPGSLILSVGGCGCNLSCPFCQNSEISMSDGAGAYVSPGELIDRALALVPRGNIGIAYTYNEPLISYEYIRDCAALAHEHGLKNVLVTNGCFYTEPISDLLINIDAMNVDLKAFTQSFYDRLGGRLETVKRFIAENTKSRHVEVTTLIIPGENDSSGEMHDLSKWLCSVSPDIPLHVSRFFPRYKMADKASTPVGTVYALADAARAHLKYVYTGNC